MNVKQIIITTAIFLLFAITWNTSFSQINSVNDSVKIQNIMAFAKLYGYVRYFHPSDESSSINWDKFAIYGVKMVEGAKNTDELMFILNSLFKPVAPSILLVKTGDKINFDKKINTPKNLSHYKTIAWQHKGIYLSASKIPDYQSPYKSIRVNKITKVDKGGNSFGNVMTYLNAEMYRGKEIKMTGKVKIIPGTEGTGHLWIRVDKNNGEMGFFNNMDKTPIVSKSWGNYEITGTIDNSAKNIALGCFLMGKGELYVDDIYLYFKDGDNWVEIPIKNTDFESESINEKNSTWFSRGNEYTISLSDKYFVSGKRSVSIKYIGNIVSEYGKPLFKKYPKFGEVINKEIGLGITCIVPLAIYGNEEGTYPSTNSGSLQKLIQKLDTININDYNSLYTRLSDIVITWNIFQHFFPYFDVSKPDWNKELIKALCSSYKCQSQNEFLLILEELTAPLKDGHIDVSGPDTELYYYPPIDWEWIENKLIITKVLVDSLKIHVGDIIYKIDNQQPKLYFDSFEKYISAATDGRRKEISKYNSLYGKKSDLLNLEQNNGNKISLKRDFDLRKYYSLIDDKINLGYKFLQDGIVYLDLTTLEMKTIRSLLPKLIKSNYIICDMRGYPNNNHGFISYLLEKNDTAKHWLKVPEIIYPNYENLAGFEESGWELKSKTPHLNAKIIFLIDANAISYAESYLGIIEGYKLATFIGQPTAGTNGDINSFNLPGGYYISFTGLKVVKLNGKQFHGIGIIPDIYVNKTIKGVIEGRDEFLERAMEYIKTGK